jgi:hypothetical protein
VDDGSDPNNMQQHFGLLHIDLSPKPGFQTLQSVVDILTSGKPVTVSTDASGVSVASGYQSSGKAVRLAWLATNEPTAKLAWSPGNTLGAAFRAASATGQSSESYLTFTPTTYVQQ